MTRKAASHATTPQTYLRATIHRVEVDSLDKAKVEKLSRVMEKLKDADPIEVDELAATDFLVAYCKGRYVLEVDKSGRHSTGASSCLPSP